LAADRQTNPNGSLASNGHAALNPLQVSATSHTPADGWQVVVLGKKTSTGQVMLEPVHVSPTSHGPAAARHVRPAPPAAYWQACWMQLSMLHGLPSLQSAVVVQPRQPGIGSC
jgi:hypothetical protein